ncbi:hypothetical protein QW060_25485 [Myroides ceti]|uniref:Uncharacterized protein n=1 Tax=Paenimyroides ceti TaxID=395087 RepID=A0ABT8D0T3_9FLAO|nr:hypothetical protein [Paenimyroides ceti]MDN3710222.1 hypothetical protein [Paenimyroides ceti]
MQGTSVFYYAEIVQINPILTTFLLQMSTTSSNSSTSVSSMIPDMAVLKFYSLYK